MTNGSTSDTSTNAGDGAGAVCKTKMPRAAGSRCWTSDDAAEAEDTCTGIYIAHATVSLEPKPIDFDAWTKFLAGFVNGIPDLRRPWRTRSAKTTRSPNGCSSKAPIAGEFQECHPRIERSRLRVERDHSHGKVVEHWFSSMRSACFSTGAHGGGRNAVTAADRVPSNQEAPQQALNRRVAFRSTRGSLGEIRLVDPGRRRAALRSARSGNLCGGSICG